MSIQVTEANLLPDFTGTSKRFGQFSRTILRSVLRRFPPLPLLILSMSAQKVEVGVYRPGVSEQDMRYAPAGMDRPWLLSPLIHFYARECAPGNLELDWTLLAGGKSLTTGKERITLDGGIFEVSLPLVGPFPDADRVTWVIRQEGKTTRGTSLLAWSNFKGKVTYEDGAWRPTYIQLHSHTWLKGQTLHIPVAGDGTFQAKVPKGIYAVLNVNGAGYCVDAMERWGWDYDLREDREDHFRLGRTELYSMHAFTIQGGPPTVFVTFRPTSLSRMLRLIDPSDRTPPKNSIYMQRITETLTKDPCAIAPELSRSDVKVWMDDVAYPIASLDRVTEMSGSAVNQVQYILQFVPPRKPIRGVAHEIRVEVLSTHTVDGKTVTDFGQSSVGLYPD